MKETNNIVPKAESNIIEFKSTFNAGVIEALVAFANAKGGSVYVGVSDDSTVVGVDLKPETLQNWINEIKNKTAPALIPDVQVLTFDGHDIVLFSTIEFPIKPVSVKGKYYTRVRNSNHLLSLNEILNLHIKTFNSSWDYYIDVNHTVLDISDQKVETLMQMFNFHKKIPLETDVFLFLTKQELIRENKLTYAGFLLLMKENAAISTIELGHFQDAIIIKDGMTLSTDLISELEEVLAFIRKHISKEYIITGNPAREERWEYPLDALREIVMNMIVHRDYSHHGDSVVKIFPDKIQFFNPGRLPDSIQEEDLLKGRYVSDCRNKLISKIFKEINWIEKYGTGISRITELFLNYGLTAPTFENFQHGFMVTVFARKVVGSTISKNVPDNVPDNVPESRLIFLLNSIRENKSISIKELALLNNVDSKTIKRDLEKLKQKGLLRRIGPDKGGHWEVR